MIKDAKQPDAVVDDAAAKQPSGEAYPVAESEKNASSEYDKKKDEKGYWRIFQSVDTDGSGSVDSSEFKILIEGLGMALSSAEVEQLIKDADEDKNGTIEFSEFVHAMDKAGSRRGSAQPSLASLINRQQKCAKMTWQEDRLGGKIVIDHETSTVSRAGEGWGVAVLAPWMPDDEKRNRGSVILEVAAPSGIAWIGIVGRNFAAPGGGQPATWFEQELTDIKSERRSHATCCRSSDGVICRHGAELPYQRARPFGCPGAPRVQIDYNGDDREMVLRVLDSANEQLAEVTIEQVKNEAAVAVCFGPTPAGAPPSTARLVGSSIEKVEKRSRRASKDLWDDDNVVTPLASGRAA